MWSIWIYSYEPIGSKGKNPIKIISYRVPMIFLDTKGWLKLLRVIRWSFFVDSSPIFIVTSRRWMKWYIHGIRHVQFGTRKLGKKFARFEFSISYMHCILERREHTTVGNTHMEDFCVGGVAVLLNAMAKLTLWDVDLTVLPSFIRKQLVANVRQIWFADTCIALIHSPSLSCTHAPSRVKILSSPLAPTIYL